MIEFWITFNWKKFFWYLLMMSTLVQVMAWCHLAPSHNMSQWWPRYMTPYDITRQQWVNRSICCRHEQLEKSLQCCPVITIDFLQNTPASSVQKRLINSLTHPPTRLPTNTHNRQPHGSPPSCRAIYWVSFVVKVDFCVPPPSLQSWMQYRAKLAFVATAMTVQTLYA